MPTVERTYHKWAAICLLEAKHAAQVIRRHIEDNFGASHLNKISETPERDMLFLELTDDALASIKSMPIVKQCIPFPSEKELYFFQLKSVLFGMADKYAASLTDVLHEHLFNDEFNLALSEDDGFWMWCSERCAGFISRCGEIESVIRWIEDNS